MELRPQLANDQSNSFSYVVRDKRILLFIHSMQGGGSERQMSYLANELAATNEVCLVTLEHVECDSYPLDPSVQRVGLGRLHQSNSTFAGAIANLGRVQALRHEIKKWNPDRLVSFCDSSNILALLAAPKSVPVYISERSDPRKQKLGRLWEFLRRRTYPRCRRCIVQTVQVGEFLNRTKLVYADRLRTIPSAIVIPPSLIEQNVDGFVNQERSDGRKQTLIYVGRLSKEKRVDALLRAWSSLSDLHGNWRLQIVGDGQERPSLQMLANQLGVENSVTWSLWSHDVWKELFRANAYCLVSAYEGFPQSMLEAMAASLPIAVTACSPSIQETIVDGVNGLLITDDARMVDTLRRLMTDSDLRKTLGQNAAATAQNFSWTKLASDWHRAISDA
jgi:GalNAc-alpha-(1->4)-GalNAc-alpha-(1->3)-diNAcBac-PP-undecaprenol alpha-1,4-N-acetyl-D-galactosaminyltransferase